MPRLRSNRLLVVLAYVGFVSLGLPDGLLGVATPSIRASFALAPEDIGALLLAVTTGYLLSSFNSGWIVARIGVGTLLALSGLATAVSMLGYAVASAWWLMLVFAVLSGLGGGAIDAALNAWVATRHSARTINWLHAFYGVGASTGPLVMTAVLASGHAWRAGYAVVGSAQLVLGLCFAATRRLWRVPPPGAGGDAASFASSPPRRAPAGALATLRLPAVWLSLAVFFTYTGIEATAGVWSYSMLTQSRGVPAATAGLWLSLFWAGLTVGRFGFGSLATAARLVSLLRLSLLAIALGAALVALDLGDAATCMGLILCGLAMAPIYPSLIATTPARLGATHTGNAVGFQVAAAVLGAALLPTIVGVVVGWRGLEVVGPSMLGLALALLVLHEVLQRAAPAAQPIG